MDPTAFRASTKSDGTQDNSLPFPRLTLDDNASPPPKSTSGGNVPSIAWKIGDRVLAFWPQNGMYYAACIERCEGSVYFVKYDDGYSGWVEGHQVRTLQIPAGELVCFPDKSQMGRYELATLRTHIGDRVNVELDNGDMHTCRLAEVAIPFSDQHPIIKQLRTKLGVFRVGDRVWVVGEKGYLYAGIILEIRGEQALARFDHGAEQMVREEHLYEDTLDVGSRIEGRWMGGAVYYAGKIARRQGEVVDVHYDDGDKETTYLSFLRVNPNPSSLASINWRWLIWIGAIIFFVLIRIVARTR